MASLKAIRRRISSVRSTQQITKAMKMVAAAKLRRAQEAAVAARPYAAKLEGMVANLAARTEEGVHPLLRTPETSARSLVIVVSSDRGLCGGYNANLGRLTETFLREHGGTPHLVAVGRKAGDFLRRRGATPAERHAMPPAATASGVARSLARQAEQLFTAGEVDSVHLIYSAFRSAISQVPTTERLLPFEREALRERDDTGTDYLFEPSPDEIIGYLLPRLLEVRILHGLLEAGASEQGARMSAMDSATRNASEMIGRLTLEMNRARQAAITKELMEIVGGAEALKA
jgi:F-type H+-transporting ATPase subunit gamma